MVVNHDIGFGEALHATRGHQFRVTRPGANQVNDGFSHGVSDFTAKSGRSALARKASSRISPAPCDRRSLERRTLSPRGSARGPRTTDRTNTAAVRCRHGGDEFEFVVAQRVASAPMGVLTAAAQFLDDTSFGIQRERCGGSVIAATAARTAHRRGESRWR